MKVRSGMDMVETARIKRLLTEEKSSFFSKCFTDEEIAFVSERSVNRQAESYAARFAAKEAAAKALGTGICTNGIGFHDFVVLTDGNGAPKMDLRGQARKYAEKIGVFSISISLTHEKDYAAAVCTLLTNEEN